MLGAGLSASSLSWHILRTGPQSRDSHDSHFINTKREAQGVQRCLHPPTSACWNATLQLPWVDQRDCRRTELAGLAGEAASGQESDRSKAV